MIFTTEVYAGSRLAAASKAATAHYHTSVKNLNKQQRKEAPLLFILVVEACWDTVASIIGPLKLANDSWIKLACTAYHEQLGTIDPTEKIPYLRSQWRYARFRTASSKLEMMPEVCVSPTATEETETVLKELIDLMCLAEGCVRKHGVAPKKHLEQRVEAILKTVNIWK